MSELTEKLKEVRNNGSRRQAHIDLACECIREVETLQRQLAEAREIVAGMDIYIEAECHEAWANNYEIRESAFVDMAKKLKQIKEKGDDL